MPPPIQMSGSERYLVAYTSSKARHSLFRCVSDAKRVDKLKALTGADEIRFGKRTADGATMGEWLVKFSGRTQRDAYIGGELPYVGDLA